MIIFPYPKPTKCYGDTVIRHAENIVTFSLGENRLHLGNKNKS